MTPSKRRRKSQSESKTFDAIEVGHYTVLFHLAH